MANLSYKRGKFEFRIPIGKPSTWLPAVAALLCLLMFAMAIVILFSVGADPKSGPAALPTSTAAQGYQGLQRLLVARGFTTATNRFEDPKNWKGGEVTRGDIEIITLNDDGGTFNSEAQQRRSRRQMRDAEAKASASAGVSASESASSSADSSSSASIDYDDPAYDYYYEAPDKKRSDHVLYHPIGKAVIVVAPKWYNGGMARTNPRWAADAKLIEDESLGRVLAFLSPVTESTSPNADRDTDNEDAGSASDSSASASEDKWIEVQAPEGKAVYDDGDTLTTYDTVPYDITHTPAKGALTVHGDLLPAPINIGRISDLQSIKGPNLTPLLLGPDGEVLISRLTVTGGRAQPKVPVYLISDPDLLNNQIFADPKKVVAALEIIDRLSPPSRTKPSVVFNLTYNNMAFDHDLLHALSRPPYIGVPLSIIVLGLGLMWGAFARFGPPKLVEEGAALGRGVQVLADNAARLMAIAMRESKLGPAYAVMVRDEVLRKRGHRLTNPNESTDELADRIGRLYGATDSYTGLKAQAATLLTVHQLIDLTKKLHAWKTEIDRANI